MKCISCEIDIPPIWVACIQKNACPNCDGPIMDQISQELLSELKLAMEKMPKADAASISGWLLSNYTLRKVGTAEPTTFHRKPTGPAPGQKLAPGRKLKVAKNSVQDFLKRKDPGIAKSIESQRDFADIVSQINSGVEDQYGNGVELETEIDEENEELSDEVVSEDYEQAEDDTEEAEYNRQNFKSKAKPLARHSIVMPGNARPLSAEETAAMMHAVSGKSNGMDLSGSDDGSGMPEVLQLQRLERLKKQRAIAEGGTDDFGSKLGIFRRH